MSRSIRKKIKDVTKEVVSQSFNIFSPDKQVVDHIRGILHPQLPKLIKRADVVSLAEKKLTDGVLEELVGDMFSRHRGDQTLLNRVKTRIKGLIDVEELITPDEVREQAKKELTGYNLSSYVREELQLMRERIKSLIVPILQDILEEILTPEVIRASLEDSLKYELPVVIREMTSPHSSWEVKQALVKAIKPLVNAALEDLPQYVDQELLTTGIREQFKQKLQERMDDSLHFYHYSLEQMIKDQIYKVLAPELKQLVTPELARAAVQRSLPQAAERIADHYFAHKGRRGFDQLYQQLTPLIERIASEVISETIAEVSNETDGDESSN
jgi:uncharacterized membrane protein YheB (UPF0754 family)